MKVITLLFTLWFVISCEAGEWLGVKIMSWEHQKGELAARTDGGQGYSDKMQHLLMSYMSTRILEGIGMKTMSPALWTTALFFVKEIGDGTWAYGSAKGFSTLDILFNELGVLFATLSQAKPGCLRFEYRQQSLHPGGFEYDPVFVGLQYRIAKNSGLERFCSELLGTHCTIWLRFTFDNSDWKKDGIHLSPSISRGI